jgi:hypothetical protein
VSNRTVAIIASMMAAVSFAHQSLSVSMRVGPVGQDGATVVELRDGNFRLRLTSGGEAMELVVVVHSPAA